MPSLRPSCCALAALILLGCAETHTTSPRPAAANLTLPDDTGGTVHPVRYTNAHRYRDDGARPSTGRAGGAALEALALIARNGVTELRLTSGHEQYGGFTPDGYLEQVVVRAFDADGTELFTRTHVNVDGGRASFTYPGLARGMELATQAVIKEVDLARAGVVAVSTPVRLRPDLAAAAIRAPRRVNARSWVNISATVRELNGDVGAHANCVLYVDGMRVDHAAGIWVDAGDVVSCAFTYLFETTGSKQLEVRVEDVDPGDYDDANNGVSTSLTVFQAGNFHYWAWAGDVTYEHASRYESAWWSADGLSGNEHGYAFQAVGREQHAGVWAWMAGDVRFPFQRLLIAQSTGGTIVQSANFLAVKPDFRWEHEWAATECFHRYFVGLRTVSFGLCVNRFTTPPWEGGPTAETSLFYDMHAGEVTYESSGYNRWWNRATGDDFTWYWNYDYQMHSGIPVRFGADYLLIARIWDADGRFVHTQPIVALEPFEHTYEHPWTCYEYSDPYWGGSRWCSEHRDHRRGVGGTLLGMPQETLP